MPAFSKISIIIASLNSARVLESCLKSLRSQKYPQSKLEILLVDGGSTDNTLNIAKKYNCHLINNPLKTAEAAKALGLSKSTGDLVALIDSDNILPNKNWLKKMILPFKDPKIIGTEPYKFTYRPNSGYIERYSALIGANDPFAYFNGNYDRYSYLSKKWTGLSLKTIDYHEYIKVQIDDNQNIPTIGANGTIFRNSFLKKYFKGDYLFDIDILAKAKKPLYFAKVKTGIIHSFCESSLMKFIKKQDRRMRDYYYYQSKRSYHWPSPAKTFPFTLYSLLIIPSLIDSFIGFSQKRDNAWFFHPVACFITWWIYAIDTIVYKLNLNKIPNREKWQQ